LQFDLSLHILLILLNTCPKQINSTKRIRNKHREKRAATASNSIRRLYSVT
jgi:hypothetical protein